MGKGRPRTPDSIKELRGTDREDRKNKKQPNYPIIREDENGVVVPPDELTGLALQEWNRLAPLLASRAVIQETDIMMLAAYCFEIGVYWDMQREIKRTKGEDRYLYIIADKALKNAIQLASRFGLTPSDRQKIVLNPPNKKKDIMENLF